MRQYILLFFLISLAQCRTDAPEVVDCDENQITRTINFYELNRLLAADILQNLAKEPTADGALGRNRAGYFHVRFQMDMLPLASYAVKFESTEALTKFIQSVEYSFQYQLPAGDFTLIVPPALQSLPPASEGDKCSGVAFFASALGSSLVLLQQSPWFQKLPSGPLLDRLNVLRDKIRKTLIYLSNQKTLLQTYDQNAPNRLLFDAVAFYSLGLYLKDDSALTIGIDFINRAIQQQDTQGFFIEGDGFDSSYNGVALKLGLTLLGMISATEPIYSNLQKSLSCCAQWQASRVLTSGEISSEGNTRVYSGGETFLGDEKQIAWVDTFLAFNFMQSLSNQALYLNLAQQIRKFYQ